ncbi:MAG TPA: hypothetical protein ENH94_11340 [Phycisphaerales bacterium]|nr:hypothetical protein [Phycisphaerales bacterium]
MAKRKKSKPTLVWHIYNFKQLYELKEDIRHKTKVLKFTRRHIGSGVDDATCQARRRWEHLKYNTPGPLYYTIRGVFDELVADAALRSAKYRGYLIDYKMEAENIKNLAGRLRLEVQDLRGYMSTLRKVGLIERVPLPNFAALDVDTETETVAKTVKKKVVKKRKVAKRRVAKKPATVIVRPEKTESPEIRENFGNPSRTTTTNDKTEIITTSGKRQSVNVNKKAASAAPLPKREKQAKGKAQTLKIHTANGVKTLQMQGQSLNPATTPSLVVMPTQADAPHGEPAQVATGPLITLTQADAGGRLLDWQSQPATSSRSFDESRFEQLYDRTGQPFALAISEALGLSETIASEQYARDMGCFCSQWSKALDGDLKFDNLAWLWDRAIKDAEALRVCARRGQRFRVSIAAVWVSRWNKLRDEIRPQAVAM